jgi:hypothetical protein
MLLLSGAFIGSFHMRCRYILRKLLQQAKQDCAEASGMYGLGPDADEVMPDIVRDAQQQQWMLDPMYFQYRGCSCLTVSAACAVAAGKNLCLKT